MAEGAPGIQESGPGWAGTSQQSPAGSGQDLSGWAAVSPGRLAAVSSRARGGRERNLVTCSRDTAALGRATN